MNKLFTKITSLALGAAMMIGVGVSVGANKSEATQVSAATSASWTQHTGTVTAGEYLIVSVAGTVCMAPTGGAVANGGYTQIAFTSSSAPDNGFTFVASDTNFKITDQTSATTYYVYASGTTNNGLRNGTSASQAGSTWTITETSTSGEYTIVSETSRQISLYSTSNWRSYGNTSGSKTNVKLFKKNVTYTVTYTAGDGSGSNYVVNDVSAGSYTLVDFGTAGFTAPTGKQFKCWSISSTEYNAGASYTVAGNTTVTALYEDLPTDPFITPSKSSTSGYTGQDETISVTYGNLTTGLAVSSGNTSVVDASIDYNDESGNADVLLEFNGAGSTTVSLKDGSTQLATISVSVTASSVTITGLAEEATCYTNETLNLGSTITVTATGSMSSDVSWGSDNESVAVVSSAGVVSPVAVGMANITVTSNDYPSATMTCEVTVEKAPQKYVIDGPDSDSAGTSLTLANLKTYYPTTNMDVEWTGVSGSIYGTSTQAMRIGTGSATGSATLSLKENASIYVTKIVINVKNYGSDSSTFVVNGDVTTNTSKSGSSTATDYEFTFSSSDTQFTIKNVSKRIYVYRIDVYYEFKQAELSADPSSFDLAVSSSQEVTLIPENFTPSSYSASVKSGSSLSASSVSFSGNVATITTSNLTGVTVLTITGTQDDRSASVDITVDVTEPRNLISLKISTASDMTTFKVGQAFDAGSLVITGTFDAAPITVEYSKANENLGLLTAVPEIGYEFLDSDIGVITTAEFELSVGTGTKSVSYSISVIDKDYATVASIDDLWDGQKVYFSNGTNSAFPKYSTGKNISSVEAVINETKGLDIESTSAFAYTVGRVKIEDTVYYTFSFEEGGSTYFIKDAGTSSDNAISKTTDSTDTTIYWELSEGSNSGQWHIVNRSNTIKPTLQVNGSYLSCYKDNQTDPYLFVVTSYSEEAVANSFVDNYLHMDSDVSGQCNTYYPILKPVWAAMADLERAAVSGEAYERLQAWAAANGEHIDNDNMDLVSNSRISLISNAFGENSTGTIVIIIVSVIAVTALGGFFFIRKRKEI